MRQILALGNVQQRGQSNHMLPGLCLTSLSLEQAQCFLAQPLHVFLIVLTPCCLLIILPIISINIILTGHQQHTTTQSASLQVLTAKWAAKWVVGVDTGEVWGIAFEGTLAALAATKSAKVEP
jgi:hypothetical protein